LAEREDFSGWRFLVAALLGMTGGLGMRPCGGGSSKRLVVAHRQECLCYWQIRPLPKGWVGVRGWLNAKILVGGGSSSLRSSE
jgi:hypothetical protein